jgi:hypothetical protein
MPIAAEVVRHASTVREWKDGSDGRITTFVVRQNSNSVQI